MTHSTIHTAGQFEPHSSSDGAPIPPSMLLQDEPVQIEPTQTAMDAIDEALMESFPCSDPPSYTRCHA